MNSTTTLVAGVGIWGVVAMNTGNAHACGGGGLTTRVSVGVAANAQRVVLAVHEAGTATVKTEVVVQIGVAETSADYAVLIPTPVTPVLDSAAVPAADLDLLEERTRPEVEQGENDGGGIGCMCAGATAAGDGSKGVEVSAPQNIGPVTAVVLEANDAAALTTWLDHNGFVIPSDKQELVAKYVTPGSSFIAIRRNDAVATPGASSVGLHYTLAGDWRRLSLAFAALGAAPTVAFTVFLAAPTPLRAGGVFDNLTLASLDPSLLAVNYEKAVATAVARARYAFVLEGTYAPEEVNPAPTSGARSFSNGFVAILGAENTLTRASTVMASGTLDTDAVFDEVGETVPRHRYLPASQRLNRGASVGLLVLAGLARALRRRLATHSKARRP